MFHKRKERKDCRGSFWRRSLSFLLVLLLMAGCVQVEYYGAAEPLVRCGESHLSGLTEPPHFVY